MKEREIFNAALSIPDPASRAAYLDEVCDGDVALRDHIPGLLGAHVKLGSFLEQPAMAVTGSFSPIDMLPIAESPGTTIGRYKLLEELGEGGMGVVYKAEQTDPVQRLVALKILKPGMDTRQVVARFEAERLALMDHPSIAHVYDGGCAESGRPYFVMELVEGIPLTDYCDQQQLATPERLELFVQVCHAVQHAHQKGIIHRDLKPSNILVTLCDGVPLPKIIDFGIAKAMHRPPDETALTTGHGLIMGTPLYMSPEQAGTGGLDVDTRSDIYSLGVVVYELLTGSTPFDQERVQKAGYRRRYAKCDANRHRDVLAQRRPRLDFHQQCRRGCRCRGRQHGALGRKRSGHSAPAGWHGEDRCGRGNGSRGPCTSFRPCLRPERLPGLGSFISGGVGRRLDTRHHSQPVQPAPHSRPTASIVCADADGLPWQPIFFLFGLPTVPKNSCVFRGFPSNK